MNEDVLKEWEPGAPPFHERKAALSFAHESGFKTSISIEPCLDPDPRPLVKIIRPFVTESIWLGPMNYCGRYEFNSLETLKNWVTWFKNDPLINFKDSLIHKINGVVN